MTKTKIATTSCLILLEKSEDMTPSDIVRKVQTILYSKNLPCMDYISVVCEGSNAYVSLAFRGDKAIQVLGYFSSTDFEYRLLELQYNC